MCGIGFIVNINGNKSHDTVDQALQMLIRLSHRGGQGADPHSGDGAGILTQVPHELLADWCAEQGADLPEAGGYGVGMLFLPTDDAARLDYEARLERIVRQEGFRLLAWRTVPVEVEVLGASARSTKPAIRQLLVTPLAQTALAEGWSMERHLYVIRKRAEREIGGIAERSGHPFYFASLSARTIVYKGLLLPDQLPAFYADLQDARYTSALALVHSRFSTNTFPSWERAHPNRYAIHNGEINTIKGNVNWMLARETKCSSEQFPDMLKIRPIIDASGSDSSMLDNCLEFLHLSGRPLAQAVMMMIPEPWAKDPLMNEGKKAFYEYHSCLMEPWDGPAAIAFSDGRQIGACLDRNGLRPARYCVTDDGRVILASEVGVIDIPPERIVRQDRLRPGQMLLVDTELGRILPDEEIKATAASERPYRAWLDEQLVDLAQLADRPAQEGEPLDERQLLQLQRCFGYTFEECHKLLKPLAEQGEDPVGSMGYDGPLAVLSDKPQLLYNYFKQMFAQVTNPPIDAFLEEMITSIESTIGSEGNLLRPGPGNCRRIRLPAPIVTDEELQRIRDNRLPGLRAVTLPMLFVASAGGKGLKRALGELFQAADQAIDEGAAVLILSDRGVGSRMAPIPALLAVAGLHHHLIRSGRRTAASLLVESAEPREVHHVALLLGYGASAVNPYLAFASIEQMQRDGRLAEGRLSREQAIAHYMRGIGKGILKVMAKMGISTVQSYIGAQIFEAIGISQDTVDKYFTRTPSSIGGIGIATIAGETLQRHAAAFAAEEQAPVLESGDDLQWRSGGEPHLYSPHAIHSLQQACRTGNYGLYKQYSQSLDGESDGSGTLRGLLQFAAVRQAIPLDQVEPVEMVLRRFKSGAMSFGSISKEAHETLAIAMNRIGGKSNSGEGGEDSARYVPDANGDRRASAIKQVASGRFGVTSHYLVNASEIQIKMAQGAKPGEGGQLPAHKVYPWVAAVRGSTPGVELISPPPHHDIYSIEDLAELIFDLKNANPQARINVKLVSEAGVGTIAAGVAKAQADVILISGFDGGTGAATRSSIKHAGMPWEIGLAETHQTLVENGLRGRVRLEADGKLMTGRDVVVAAMLGADEFGFATLPLVAMGCVMMRVCHLDTCPVGIATQNPELRAKFAGKPEHVEQFMRFIAQEVREWMARLGIRKMSELIGRADLLQLRDVPAGRKAAAVDLSALLRRPKEAQLAADKTFFMDDAPDASRSELDLTLDRQKLLPLSESVWNGLRTERVQAILPIRNTDRSVGTLLGSEVTRRFGAQGLPEDTIQLHFHGAAGQSFGAFVPKGITLTLEGQANDYVGKGLSGGKLAVFPPSKAAFVPEESMIVGNVALFGATSGEAYIRGVAGERFCVRNSGADVVVEGVGNHGCEYMTGGRVVILGNIGKNFAAGMSGGIAYIWNRNGAALEPLCNRKLVEIAPLDACEDENEAQQVRGLIERHVKYTHSEQAQFLLDHWERSLHQLVRVIPRDYKRMLQTIERFRQTGASGEEAELAAFQARKQA